MKIDDIINILYPNIDEMSEEDQSQVMYDKEFLMDVNNMSTFIEWLKSIHPNSPAAQMTEQKRMREAMWHAKVEKYFATLYPDYATMTPEQRFEVFDEKTFIIKNTEALDKWLKSIPTDSPVAQMTEQERMRMAIDKVKLDLDKNGEKGTSLYDKENRLSGLETERKEKEAQVRELESTQSLPTQGE